jgi:hypothetical protein
VSVLPLAADNGWTSASSDDDGIAGVRMERGEGA